MLDIEAIKKFIQESTATAFLVALLICSFLASYIWGEGATHLETARRFGAITPQDATTDELLRLISYTFLQIGGPIHLLMNLSLIVVAGPFLERVYGAFKYVSLFLITGIFGGLFVLMFSEQNIIVGGASGSGYGLMGLYLGLVLKKHPWIDNHIKNWVYNLIWINIIFTFAMPGISISGHMGGLLSGLVLAFLIPPQSHANIINSTPLKSILNSILAFIFVTLVLYIPKYLSPATVLPYIQEVRIKFGLTPAILSNSLFNENTISNKDESEVESALEPFIQILGTNYIELILCAILILLILTVVRRISLSRKISHYIRRNNQLYSLAKYNGEEHIIYQIFENTVYQFQDKYNNKRLRKSVQFEINVLFEKPWIKLALNTLKVLRLLILLFLFGLLIILILIIFENI